MFAMFFNRFNARLVSVKFMARVQHSKAGKCDSQSCLFQLSRQ